MIIRFLKDLIRRLKKSSTIPGLIIGVGGVMVLTSMLNLAGLFGLIAIAAGVALCYAD